MSFQLRFDEDLSAEMPRLLLEQIDIALDALRSSPSDEAIHQTRKVGKRSRAVLALVRPGLGKARTRLLDRRYRDMARPLSPLRDADVRAATLRALGAPPPTGSARPISNKGVGDLLESTRAELRELSGVIVAQPWRDVARRHIVSALGASYKRAYQLRGRALSTEHGETWHDWRKAVKAWYYHLQLVQDLWPEVLAPMVAALDSLQETLGDHNDLMVLPETLRDEVELLGSLRSKIDERSASLREQAASGSKRLFAVAPGVQRAWLEGIWRAVNR